MTETVDLQQLVLNRAKEMLKGGPICLDRLQPEHEIKRRGIEDCAKELYLDTEYWEGRI